MYGVIVKEHKLTSPSVELFLVNCLCLHLHLDEGCIDRLYNCDPIWENQPLGTFIYFVLALTLVGKS